MSCHIARLIDQGAFMKSGDLSELYFFVGISRQFVLLAFSVILLFPIILVY